MIHDQFTALIPKLGRQRVWQLRQAAKGKCQKCNRKATHGNLCKFHKQKTTSTTPPEPT